MFFFLCFLGGTGVGRGCIINFRGRSAGSGWRVSGSMSACVLWFGEEEGHSLAHRGTDYYLVREESCAEQDVPHVVLCYVVSPLRSFLFTPLPFRLYPFLLMTLVTYCWKSFCIRGHICAQVQMQIIPPKQKKTKQSTVAVWLH